MHEQHQKGIHPTIPKDPIDDHKTYTVREKKKQSKQTLSFPSLLTATTKKPYTYLRPL